MRKITKILALTFCLKLISTGLCAQIERIVGIGSFYSFLAKTPSDNSVKTLYLQDVEALQKDWDRFWKILDKNHPALEKIYLEDVNLRKLDPTISQLKLKGFYFETHYVESDFYLEGLEHLEMIEFFSLTLFKQQEKILDLSLYEDYYLKVVTEEAVAYEQMLKDLNKLNILVKDISISLYTDQHKSFSIDYLNLFPNVKKLDIKGGIKELPQGIENMQFLEKLYISSNILNDQGIRYLSACPKLQEITLYMNNDRIPESLSSLKSLKKLNIYGGIPDKDLAAINWAKFETVEEISLGGYDYYDRSKTTWTFPSYLAALPQLQKLALSIDTLSFSQVSKHLKWPKLTTLEMDIKEMNKNSAQLESDYGLGAITDLTIRFDNLAKENQEFILQRCPNLKSLSIDSYHHKLLDLSENLGKWIQPEFLSITVPKLRINNADAFEKLKELELLVIYPVQYKLAVAKKIAPKLSRLTVSTESLLSKNNLLLYPNRKLNYLKVEAGGYSDNLLGIENWVEHPIHVDSLEINTYQNVIFQADLAQKIPNLSYFEIDGTNIQWPDSVQIFKKLKTFVAGRGIAEKTDFFKRQIQVGLDKLVVYSGYRWSKKNTFLLSSIFDKKGLGTLKELDIYSSKNLSGLACLKEAKSLKRLKIDHSLHRKIDKDLSFLEELTELEFLSVEHIIRPESQLPKKLGSPKLKTLIYYGFDEEAFSEKENEFLSLYAKSTKLDRLDLNFVNNNGIGTKVLKELSQSLKHLSLCCRNYNKCLSKQVVENIFNGLDLQNLETLSLEFLVKPEVNSILISKFPKLKKVNLLDENIAKRLQAAKPNLVVNKLDYYPEPELEEEVEDEIFKIPIDINAKQQFVVYSYLDSLQNKVISTDEDTLKAHLFSSYRHIKSDDIQEVVKNKKQLEHLYFNQRWNPIIWDINWSETKLKSLFVNGFSPYQLEKKSEVWSIETLAFRNIYINKDSVALCLGQRTDYVLDIAEQHRDIRAVYLESIGRYPQAKIEALQKLPKLETLHLKYDCHQDVDALLKVVNRLDRLKVLILELEECVDYNQKQVVDLSLLEDLKELEQLELRYSNANLEIKPTNRLRTLESFILEAKTVSNLEQFEFPADLEKLLIKAHTRIKILPENWTNSPKVKQLSIWGSQVNAPFEELSKAYPNLISLDWSDGKIENLSDAILTFKKLATLKLNRCGKALDLSLLAKMPTLRHLEYGQASTASTGYLKRIYQLQQLEFLRLGLADAIFDNGDISISLSKQKDFKLNLRKLPNLKGFSGSKRMEIDFKFTVKSVENLNVLELDNFNLDELGKLLPKTQNLSKLSLYSDNNITRSVDDLILMVEQNKELQELNLDLTNQYDKIHNLWKFRKLDRLGLRFPNQSEWEYRFDLKYRRMGYENHFLKTYLHRPYLQIQWFK
ncbi:MAG: hypothetical protein MK212_08100 [Saprospiraceae bacterium]|nr:hypothetical protein [Saprospiraceae bacterium]